MRKRLLALLLCVVMVSAIAVTGAVSAKNENNIINSSIRQYDVMYYAPGSETGKVVGKVTIDGETGHYIVNVNLGRAGLNLKSQEGQVLWVELRNPNSFGLSEQPDEIPTGYGLAIPTYVNAGGIGHVVWTYYLIPQWFSGGAVDQAPTDARFECIGEDCIA